MKKLYQIILLSLLFITKVSADGSMRIEVEVYNGPLSKSIEVQKTELVSTVNITSHVLGNLTRAIHISQCRLGCFGSKVELDDDKSTGDTFERCSKDTVNSNFPYSSRTDIDEKLKNLAVSDMFPSETRKLLPEIFPIKNYKQLSPHRSGTKYAELNRDYYEKNGMTQFYWTKDMAAIPTKNNDAKHQVCPLLSDVKFNTLHVLNYIKRTGIVGCREDLVENVSNNGQMNKESMECLTQIANVGKLLSEGAEHWAATQVAVMPTSKRTRISIARAAVTAAELGNELTARADAIIKQEKGADLAELLPTSVFLRDSEGTDYLNMFEWLNATPRKNRQWSTQSRTRMIERLINDNNWSKINTAFAQGKGKVNMVFAKDDIGNWNLKNYDNDPSEMLDAYKIIGTNLFTSAAKLAKKMTSVDNVIDNIAGVQQSVQQGQNLVFGANANIDDNIANTMESRIKQRIESTYREYEGQIKLLNTKITELEDLLKTKQKQIDNTDKKFSDIDKEFTAKKSKITKLEIKLEESQEKYKTANEQVNTQQPTNEQYDTFVTASNDLANIQAELSIAKTELANFEEQNKASIEEQQKLIAEVTTIKTELTAKQDKLVQLPNQAVLVIEEILNNYHSSLTALQESMVENLAPNKS
ncbi:hypothetical protein [Thalassomonas sp. RHCl1]|uniref:hypothetical protein n=1 Tax=Thalassomonas sp. RHCl1 TaxID=2995320 RepID=UPI00248B42DE|nr:hypothetical protein [Thalassomonas sp. RHCl1]